MVGPAYISNFEDFQGEKLILIPTLAGMIAEGIMLSTESSSANLKVEFNCQEQQEQNKVSLSIPVRDSESLKLNLSKDCGMPAAQIETNSEQVE